MCAGEVTPLYPRTPRGSVTDAVFTADETRLVLGTNQMKFRNNFNVCVKGDMCSEEHHWIVSKGTCWSVCDDGVRKWHHNPQRSNKRKHAEHGNSHFVWAFEHANETRRRSLSDVVQYNTCPKTEWLDKPFDWQNCQSADWPPGYMSFIKYQYHSTRSLITSLFEGSGDSFSAYLQRTRARFMHAYNGNVTQKKQRKSKKKSRKVSKKKVVVVKTASRKKGRRAGRKKQLREQAAYLREAGNPVNGKTITGHGDYEIGRNLGSKVGGWIGNWLEGAVRKIFGSGDYEIGPGNTGAITNNSLLQADTIPTMHGGAEGAVNVRHTEFLRNGNMRMVFDGVTFPIDPTSPFTFPWLHAIALQFQQYTIKGMVIIIRSLTSATAIAPTQGMGSVFGSVRYDVEGLPPTDKQEILNSVFANSSKPSDSFMLAVECARGQTPIWPLKIRQNGINPTELQFYTLGYVDLYTEGAPNDYDDAFEIHVSYDIDFYKPRQPAGPGGPMMMLDLNPSTTKTIVPVPNVPYVTQPRINTIGATLAPDQVSVLLPPDMDTRCGYLVTYVMRGNTNTDVTFINVTPANGMNYAFGLFNQQSTYASAPYTHTNTNTATIVWTGIFTYDGSGSDINMPRLTFEYAAPATLPPDLVGGNLFIIQLPYASVNGYNSLPSSVYTRKQFFSFLSLAVQGKRSLDVPPGNYRLVDWVHTFQRTLSHPIARPPTRSVASMDMTLLEALAVMAKYSVEGTNVISAYVNARRTELGVSSDDDTEYEKTDEEKDTHPITPCGHRIDNIDEYALVQQRRRNREMHSLNGNTKSTHRRSQLRNRNPPRRHAQKGEKGPITHPPVLTKCAAMSEEEMLALTSTELEVLVAEIEAAFNSAVSKRRLVYLDAIGSAFSFFCARLEKVREEEAARHNHEMHSLVGNTENLLPPELKAKLLLLRQQLRKYGEKCIDADAALAKYGQPQRLHRKCVEFEMFIDECFAPVAGVQNMSAPRQTPVHCIYDGCENPPVGGKHWHCAQHTGAANVDRSEALRLRLEHEEKSVQVSPELQEEQGDDIPVPPSVDFSWLERLPGNVTHVQFHVLPPPEHRDRDPGDGKIAVGKCGAGSHKGDGPPSVSKCVQQQVVECDDQDCSEPHYSKVRKQKRGESKSQPGAEQRTGQKTRITKQEWKLCVGPTGLAWSLAECGRCQSHAHYASWGRLPKYASNVFEVPVESAPLATNVCFSTVDTTDVDDVVDDMCDKKMSAKDIAATITKHMQRYPPETKTSADGYYQCFKPERGSKRWWAEESKRSAGLILCVHCGMETKGWERCFVCGHDRGADVYTDVNTAHVNFWHCDPIVESLFVENSAIVRSAAVVTIESKSDERDYKDIVHYAQRGCHYELKEGYYKVTTYTTPTKYNLVCNEKTVLDTKEMKIAEVKTEDGKEKKLDSIELPPAGESKKEVKLDSKELPPAGERSNCTINHVLALSVNDHPRYCERTGCWQLLHSKSPALCGYHTSLQEAALKPLTDVKMTEEGDDEDLKLLREARQMKDKVARINVASAIAQGCTSYEHFILHTTPENVERVYSYTPRTIWEQPDSITYDSRFYLREYIGYWCEGVRMMQDVREFRRWYMFQCQDVPIDFTPNLADIIGVVNYRKILRAQQSRREFNKIDKNVLPLIISPAVQQLRQRQAAAQPANNVQANVQLAFPIVPLPVAQPVNFPIVIVNPVNPPPIQPPQVPQAPPNVPWMPDIALRLVYYTAEPREVGFWRRNFVRLLQDLPFVHRRKAVAVNSEERPVVQISRANEPRLQIGLSQDRAIGGGDSYTPEPIDRKTNICFVPKEYVSVVKTRVFPELMAWMDDTNVTEVRNIHTSIALACKTGSSFNVQVSFFQRVAAVLYYFDGGRQHPGKDHMVYKTWDIDIFLDTLLYICQTIIFRYFRARVGLGDTLSLDFQGRGLSSTVPKTS